MGRKKGPEYWGLYPIEHNWCIHNQGYMTTYGDLYCKLRQMTVNRDYQCKDCKDKEPQLSLF